MAPSSPSAGSTPQLPDTVPVPEGAFDPAQLPRQGTDRYAESMTSGTAHERAEQPVPDLVAEAYHALIRLAEEQAALRRVATLIAQDAEPAEVFAAVSAEVARVFRLDPATMDVAVVGRFEAGPALLVVGISKSVDVVPLGSRWNADELFAPTHVLRTGRSARVGADEIAAVGGGIAEFLQRHGYLSQVASPIVVDGTLWGAMSVNSSDELPPDTERRLERFTELIATAIAKIESRRALKNLAEEQTALRRVATLVAREVSPHRVFAAVCEQIGHLLDADITALEVFPGDGTVTLAAAWSREDASVPIGTRLPIQPNTIAARIASTQRAARRDGSNDAHVDVGPFARDLELRSTVGAPIMLGSRVWGGLMAGTAKPGQWAEEAEARLAAFSEFIAIAIANAESRDALAHLAEEQAALRRVATLVARDASPGEVFDAVAMEVGTLLDTDITVVGRYDGDGAATAIGSWSASPGGVPVGTRSALGGRNVLTLVAETQKPARTDGYEDASGEAAEIARRHGWSSSIAAPIIVEDRLWGVMLVATQRPKPFPADAEKRLAAFTDLVATALANAQAHDAVQRFGDEQAALGRVATLVASGAAPERVFKAVVDEASTLLGLERIEFVRYDGGNTATVIAASGEHPFPAGSKWSLEHPSVMATVARTARPARIDDYSALEGAVARAARGAGFQSAIGAPLTVEGKLWGAIIAISTQPEPIQERSVARLGQFTGLVATAVANAEARQAIERVAAEQTTLRGIATLVAQGAQPEEVFAAVSREVESIFDASAAVVVKFDHDPPTLTIVGTGDHMHSSAIGTRYELAEDYASTAVYRTGHSARKQARSGEILDGPVYAAARDVASGNRLEVTSVVASPLTVDGRLWGAISVSTAESLPPDTEVRLERFADIVATAIANADSRQAFATLAAEQDGLRRIATQVAQESSPEHIFAAVSNEIAALIGSPTVVLRFDGQGPSIIVEGASTEIDIPIGTRLDLSVGKVSGQVYRTGRSARVDDADWSAGSGPGVDAARRLGVMSHVATPIVVEGHLWGTITVNGRSRLRDDVEERMQRFTELVATAIANAEGKSELAASRRRIVAAGDEARRRIERDLHDGIQQRLIALALRARAMKRRSPEELPGMATELAEGLKDVSDELREIARGIHPTILGEAGLGPALRALARRSDIPVDVDVRLDERLPAAVEAAAYYIASEALTNVAKHAHASVVELHAARQDGILVLQVRDDGIGGADADRGSGLIGLKDRVDALGGTISIASPVRGGTMVSIRLPVAT